MQDLPAGKNGLHFCYYDILFGLFSEPSIECNAYIYPRKIEVEELYFDSLTLHFWFDLCLEAKAETLENFLLVF